MVWTNPSNRQYEKGIFGVQNRGQVWSIRTLGQVAYISPDDDPLKQYFTDRVNDNIFDRTTKWATPSANTLGAIQDYDYPKYSPWQNDWFAWVFGYLIELDFSQAATMRAWLSQWPTGRMGIGNNEFCFQYAATYTYPAAIGTTRDSYYSDFRTLYEANFPTEATQTCDPSGEMTGYPNSTAGYYSNMQPGLAIAVDSGVADYDVHWARFVGVPTKPDYNDNPIWAIVPRQQQGTPRPLIALSVTPAILTSEAVVSITWSTLNADSCSASGAWSGVKDPNPTQPENITVSVTSTFTLNCTGVGGSTTRSVTVTMNDSDTGTGGDNTGTGTVAVSNVDGGGGALNMPVLLILILLALYHSRIVFQVNTSNFSK